MSFLRKIPLAIKFLFDKDVPFRKKILIILGAIYLISPIDLVPDPVLLLGVVDDLTIIAFILNKLSSDLDKYELEKDKSNREKNIKGKIIENIDYDIKDE